MESEGTFWDKQIKRHHTGKRIRKLIRKEIENLDKKEKQNPFIHLARKLRVSRKTIWALANGLTTASQELIERIEGLEK